MILSEIQDYLQQRGRATLADLANRFDSEPEALRAMLDRFIRKGRVRRLGSEGQNCSGCAQCAAAQIEMYEWLDSAQSARPRQGMIAGTRDR